MKSKRITKGERLNWEPLDKVKKVQISICDIKGEKITSKPSKLLIE
nr:hypothetical protein [uncultured Flavobacterium sp.]